MTNQPKYSLQTVFTESFIILLLWSIVYSKFMLSVSMIALLILSILHFEYFPKIRISIRKDLWSNLLIFIKSPPYLSLLLLFFVVVLSGVNSDNTHEWFHHLRLKFPYLVLPFAFFSFSDFHKKRYYRYYYYFIILMTISILQVGVNYSINYEEFYKNIGKGQSIPTPVDHIKYSLMLAISSIASLYLFIKRYQLKYKWEPIILLLLSIITFIFLHFLAVRSGLVSAYLGLAIILLSVVWKKNKTISLVTMMALIALPFLSYHYIPSLHKKVDYMKYDYEMYLKGEGDNYSDSERLFSYKVAINLFKESPLLGTGIGDLKQSCIDTYDSLFPEKNLQFKYPHNQYLFVLAGMGIIGLIIFLMGIFTPLIYHAGYKDQLLLIFIAVLTISFLVENTIERSYSLVFHLTFVLFALNYKKSQKTNLF